MGVPVIESLSEAEAQCAALTKAGITWATASEDSDSLVFGTNILLTHMSSSDYKKRPIIEYTLEKVLEGLELTYDQFIDMSILMGCDFCPKIKGIGRKRAYEFIKQYKTIEKVLENLESRYIVPDSYNYEEARKVFKSPDIIPPENIELIYEDPKVEELVAFLCQEKGFNEDRIRKGIEKLKSSANASVQTRITDFFQIKQSPKKVVDKSKKNNTPKKKSQNTNQKYS